MPDEAAREIIKLQSTVGDQERTFFSLKWKISLLSGLILLAVVMLFCTVSYFGQMNNFESQRDAEYQQYARRVNTLINNTSKSLYQIAEMIPFLDEMNEVLGLENSEKIYSVFDRHRALLQFHNNLEFVRFYSKSNQLLASWGNLGSGVHDDETILSWVGNVNQQEQPIAPLVCNNSCMRLVITPLLVEGENGGVVILGASLIDALLEFKKVSGADIGLFIEGGNGSVLFDEDTLIPEWDIRITALTTKNQNLNIINNAAQQFPHIESLEDGVQVGQNDKFHRIKLFPLEGIATSNKAYFVVITDVTSAVENIHQSIWTIAIIGLLGLIFSELILFVIFARLLSRLRGIAFSLPLLASGNFNKFRSSLSPAKRKYGYKDEADILYEAAAALSFQLESLEGKVSRRTMELIEQRDELSKERDFIAHLLDTAQVIVLVQNAGGEIITLNAYGESLLHFTEKELAGTPFLGMLASGDRLQDLPVCLKEIQHGHREEFRHEAITKCKDGSTRHIAWLYSKLDRHLDGELAILSLGLDVTEYKRVEGHLAWLADHDPLTNLFNRRRFSEELEQILSWADRYEHPGALLFFDLDRFKYINDTSGHQAGDALLKMVADMLSRIIRTVDVIGRLGGDEFAIILPEIKTKDATEVAKKILAYLNEAELTINGRTHKISASIGIALFPEHGNNVHDLLAAADLAMYQAKETGRGAWHLFSDQDESRERMYTLIYWKEKIEYAHFHNNFLLYLQPIMDVKREEIKHYEVLLRMRDEDGTVHLPTGFISAAEQTGLIHAIDHMVLRKAIALIAEINQYGRQVSFSINLSAHAFNDPELLPILKQELACHSVDPNVLLFEITETAALQNLPGARALMIEIKELGCGFVLDDFGVGFSSFYYLRELPVDTVKLDGSFIQNLVKSSDDQILVKAMCSVARGFGKKITAEFVESEEIFLQIKTMDIDYAQGYFVGKPAPYSDFFHKE